MQRLMHTRRPTNVEGSKGCLQQRAVRRAAGARTGIYDKGRVMGAAQTL